MSQPQGTDGTAPRVPWVYGITPLLAAFVLLDLSVTDGTMRQALPRAPVDLPWYGVVFGTPHIIGSFFAFADRDLRRPMARLLGVSLAVAAAAVVGAALVMSFELALALLIVATMVHACGQQCGLAIADARPAGRAARVQALAWRMAVTVTVCVMALLVGGEVAHDSLLPQASDWLLFSAATLLLATPVALSFCIIARRRGGSPGSVLAYHCTLMVAWALVAVGYPLLAILSLRFVHDATAFGFYVRLAARRESTQPGGNRLYRLLGLRGRAVPWAVVPLAIVIAAGVALTLPWLLPVLTLTHYLVEHVAWRRDSPWRASLSRAAA